MGKLVALVIGVVMWALIGFYVPTGPMYLVCATAIIYLIWLYLSSLKKKNGAA